MRGHVRPIWYDYRAVVSEIVVQESEIIKMLFNAPKKLCIFPALLIRLTFTVSR